MHEALADYLHELGQLKRVRRSGWWLAGVDDPESVAEHSFRVAAMAYVLADMEGANPERAAAMALFHDVAESRTGDQHRMAKKYLGDGREASAAVVHEQTAKLPGSLAARLRELLDDYSSRSSIEAHIVKDADELECMFQGREYESIGYGAAREWVESCRDALSTDSARKIAAACLETTPQGWRGRAS